jgi:hypothetical protein
VLLSGGSAGLVIGLLGTAFGVSGVPLPELMWAPLVMGAAGLAVAGLELVVVGAADLLSRPMRDLWQRDTRLAVGSAILLSPLFVVVAATALSGRSARALPERWVYILVATAVMMAATVIGLLWLWAAARASLGRNPPRRSSWMRSSALVLAGLVLVGADQLLLVRRYAVVHDLMAAGAFVSFQGAIGLMLAVDRRFARRRVALPLVLLALSGIPTAIRLPSRDHSGLRQALASGGSLSSRVVDAASHIPVARPQVNLDPASTMPLVPPESDRTWPTTALHPGADVVLVTVDALRADHLGLHGYVRATSPSLDRLAARAIVFEKAYAPTPHTSFSLTSLLTGRHVFRLARAGQAGRLTTAADGFRAAGYRTIGIFPPAVFFVEGERFAALQNRRLGFEEVHFQSIAESRDAVVRTDEAIRLLEKDRTRPVFMWVHHFGPHEPYVAHPETGRPSFGSRDVDRYDDEIRWVDEHLGRLLAYLDRNRPGAIVVVTADHGEEFGEHRGAYHGTSLFDEQIRVPLLLAIPGAGHVRVNTPVSTTDVLPTLLELTGIPWSAPADGGSLLGLALSGEANSRPVFAEIDGLKMAVVDRHKLLCDLARDLCQLFDLAADPLERRNLAPRLPDVRKALMTRMLTWVHREIPELMVASTPQSQLGAVVERAIRGDGDAMANLPRMLLSSGGNDQLSLEARRRAAQLLAVQPRPPKAGALGMVADRDPDLLVRAWATVATVRAGSATRLSRLAALELPHDQSLLRAYRALALTERRHPSGPAEADSALKSLDDAHARCRLISALARSGGPLALPALRDAYPDVRLRLCVARALADMPSAGVTRFVLDRLADEPYSTVRAALVRVLGKSRELAAAAALRALAIKESEPLVLASVAHALAELRARRRTSRARRASALQNALVLCRPDPSHHRSIGRRFD